jgi:hypothetical protein
MSFINPLTCSLTRQERERTQTGAGSVFWIDSRYNSGRPVSTKGIDIKKGGK